MQIRFWLSTLLTDICNRIRFKNNRKRRRSQRSTVARMSAAALLAAASLTVSEPTVVAQSDLTFLGENFAAGDQPFSVTTGDFNGDGITDLATANRTSDDVSVLLGLGDGTFATQQVFTAGDARSVTTGDFNGDGITDLATANYFDHDVSVLLGLGDGNFATQPKHLAAIHSRDSTLFDATLSLLCCLSGFDYVNRDCCHCTRTPAT